MVVLVFLLGKEEDKKWGIVGIYDDIMIYDDNLMIHTYIYNLHNYISYIIYHISYIIYHIYII